MMLTLTHMLRKSKTQAVKREYVEKVARDLLDNDPGLYRLACIKAERLISCGTSSHTDIPVIYLED